MTTKSKRRQKPRGEPFMVYFTREQSTQLKSICRKRLVSRAVLVRFAVDQLFKQLDSGIHTSTRNLLLMCIATTWEALNEGNAILLC
jgi:hypothetical protein